MDNTMFLVREEHYMKRIKRESIEIEKRENTINKGNGWKLNNAWKLIIKKLKRTYN